MQDLYILANEIRKEFKKVAFVRDGCVNIMNGKDSIIQISSKDQIPNMNKVKSMEDYVEDRLKNFDEYVRYIDSSFDPGIIITDMALLLCADRIAETLYIGECYYHFGIIHVYDKEYRHKLDLYDGLPVAKQDNPLMLRDLIIKATQGVYIQNNKAIVLDNIAYVAKNYTTYLERPERLEKVKMFGYIHMGEVTWVDVSSDAFEEVKVCNGKVIKILSSLDVSKLDSVLRKKGLLDFKDVRSYPYPIAILEDGELSYYTREIKKNANIVFRRNKKT